jgi:hypothetical protein
VRVRIEFAHGSLRTPEHEPDNLSLRIASTAIEGFVRARLSLTDELGARQAWLAWPDVTELSDVQREWSWQPLPALLNRLLEAGESGELPEIEAHVPAEVQEQLRRTAPTSWQLLLQRTRLLQRGDVYRISIGEQRVSIEHRLAGMADSEPLDSPLLDLANEIVRSSDLSPAERFLATELLRARWIHRRLPPGISWRPEEALFQLRSDPDVRIREVIAPTGTPEAFELLRAGALETRTLDARPGSKVPRAVLRAALGWILDPTRTQSELFLDPRGEVPREAHRRRSSSRDRTPEIGSRP